MPDDEVNEKYPTAIGAIEAGAGPLKIGERLMRILVVAERSKEDNNLPMIIAPNAHTIRRGVIRPLFDPGWLENFRKKTHGIK